MEKMCAVTNKSNGRTIYILKEDGIRREFYPQETKKIPLSELEKLVQQPGGRVIFYNNLFINDPAVVRALINGMEAPEYWLTEDQIPGWIETCTLAEFQDALDFAPEGVKSLIKKFAVSLPLNDYAKRQAMLDQLGYNVTAAIEHSKTDDETSENKAKVYVKPTSRRSESTIVVPSQVIKTTE